MNVRGGQDFRPQWEIDLVEGRLKLYRKRLEAKQDLFTGEPLTFLTLIRRCAYCGKAFDGGPAKKKYCGLNCCKNASNARRKARSK